MERSGCSPWMWVYSCDVALNYGSELVFQSCCFGSISGIHAIHRLHSSPWWTSCFFSAVQKKLIWHWRSLFSSPFFFFLCIFSLAAGLPLIFIDVPKWHALKWWYIIFPGFLGCLYLYLLVMLQNPYVVVEFIESFLLICYSKILSHI